MPRGCRRQRRRDRLALLAGARWTRLTRRRRRPLRGIPVVMCRRPLAAPLPLPLLGLARAVVAVVCLCCLLFMLFMLFMQLARSTLDYP